MRLYGEIIPELYRGDYRPTGAQTMLFLTCTIISSVDLAHYRVFHAKDRVSVDCDKSHNICFINLGSYKTALTMCTHVLNIIHIT